MWRDQNAFCHRIMCTSVRRQISVWKESLHIPSTLSGRLDQHGGGSLYTLALGSVFLTFFVNFLPQKFALLHVRWNGHQKFFSVPVYPYLRLFTGVS